MLNGGYNESAMSQASIYRWYEFKTSRKSAELMSRPSAPRTVLTEQTILNVPHLSVRQFASLLDILIGSTHTLILTKLGLAYMYMCVRSIFILTTTKNVCIEVYPYLKEQVANNMDYLNDVITTDETWIYCYDPAFK